jgi:hypothetical protein
MRGREDQTLYISDLVCCHAIKDPSYAKVQLGLHILSVQDAIRRIRLKGYSIMDVDDEDDDEDDDESSGGGDWNDHDNDPNSRSEDDSDSPQPPRKRARFADDDSNSYEGRRGAQTMVRGVWKASCRN